MKIAIITAGSRGIGKNTTLTLAERSIGRMDEERKSIGAQTPLCLIGLADNIGPLIAALRFDDSRWMNSQRIEASGGMHV